MLERNKWSQRAAGDDDPEKCHAANMKNGCICWYYCFPPPVCRSSTQPASRPASPASLIPLFSPSIHHDTQYPLILLRIMRASFIRVCLKTTGWVKGEVCITKTNSALESANFEFLLKVVYRFTVRFKRRQWVFSSFRTFKTLRRVLWLSLWGNTLSGYTAVNYPIKKGPGLNAKWRYLSKEPALWIH